MQAALHFILLICYTGNTENIDVQTAIMAALAIALFYYLFVTAEEVLQSYSLFIPVAPFAQSF